MFDAMSSADAALLLTAFLTGLLGSTHCVGMCGGISAALSFSLPINAQGGLPLLGYQLAYNSGRLITYTLLGALAGLLATGVLADWAHSPWPRVAVGLFMVVLGLYLAGWWMGLQHLERLGSGLWKKLTPLRQHLLPINHPAKAVAAGALWGLLPCGLVYSALSMALMRADAMASPALMLAFGVGTLPALLLTGSVAGRLRAHLQRRATRQIAGVLVMAFGLWTLGFAFMHTSHESALSAEPMPSDSAEHHHHH